MSDKGPVIGEEDEFEGLYTEKFRTLVRQFGEFVNYERDRAAIDIGVHLTTPTEVQRRVSSTRIWFQLKGRHKETLSLNDYQSAADIPVSVSLDHLKFWFASPRAHLPCRIRRSPLTASLSKMSVSWSTVDGVKISSLLEPFEKINRRSLCKSGLTQP